MSETNGSSATSPVASDAAKPIIITKSISSLTSGATTTDAGAKPTPITLDKDQKNQENVTGDDKSAEPAAKPTTPSEQDKLEMRVKKFGVQSDNVKKNLRAQRFGVATSPPASDSDSSQKLQSRAQRFGTATDSPTAASNGAKNGAGPNKEVLEKRAQRFGAVTADEPKAAAAATESDPVLLKRKERFGIVDEDAKKKLRGQRFETSA